MVERAVEWCGQLLALPPIAMSTTRRLARADLVRLFDEPWDEIGIVADAWFSDETQGVLRGIVERLASKKKG